MKSDKIYSDSSGQKNTSTQNVWKHESIEY